MSKGVPRSSVNHMHGNPFNKGELGGRGEKLSLVRQDRTDPRIIVIRVDKYGSCSGLYVLYSVLELGNRLHPIMLPSKGADKKTKILSR